MHLPQSATGRWISVLFIAFSPAVFAQQAPTAASQLQQIPTPPTLPSVRPDVQVHVEQPHSPTESGDTQVLLKGLQLQGASAFDTSELVRVAGFTANTAYTIADLRGMAAKITAHYRSQGYFVAQTLVPAQDITDGIVRLTVLEGQYGQVTLDNRSRLVDGVANTVLDGLRSAKSVTADALERRVLILSDLPGVQVKSALAPSATRGATDLALTLTPGPFVSGSLEADNQGNRYTGTNRIGASLALNEPLGLGDVAALRALSSGDGLAYGKASYQLQAWQARIGVAYANMRYALGAEFVDTQSSGTATVSSLYASYPLIRTRNNNLWLQWSQDRKNFSDHMEASMAGVSIDKIAQMHSLSMNGNLRDANGAGYSSYAVTWTRGQIQLLNAIYMTNDTNSAQSNGDYDKVSYTLTRQQEIAKGTDLFWSLSGQWSSKNLDASEKFGLGGGTGVRAYPAGEATGDQGALLTLEARTILSAWASKLPGQWQLIGFVDTGTVNVNRLPWDGSTANYRSLSGAGIGLGWVGAGDMVVKAYYAFKVGDAVATSAPDASGRLWLQISQSF